MNSLSEFSGGYFPESVQCVLPLIDVYQVFDTGDYSFWEFRAVVVSFDFPQLYSSSSGQILILISDFFYLILICTSDVNLDTKRNDLVKVRNAMIQTNYL